jgi:VWFA-related protein
MRSVSSRFQFSGASAAFALMIAALLPLASAQPEQGPKIAVEVKVVNIFASVRDKHGALQANLGKDDFILEEDGKPQSITYFSKDTDLPLALGLLVDTSLSQRRVLDQERTASRSFLDDMVQQD